MQNRIALRALTLLLVAQAAIALLRIAIVPLGFGVDEYWQFGVTRLMAAGCMRHAVGLPHAYNEQQSALGQAIRDTLLGRQVPPPYADPAHPEVSPCAYFWLHAKRGVAYYTWAALPIAVVNPVSDQLASFMSRTATLLLGLLMTVATYGITHELFPKRKLWAIGAAALTGFNQQLADLSTGTNADVGAACALGMLLWALASIHARGWSATRGVAAALALLACFTTKTSAWIGAPLAAIWLLAALPAALRRRAILSALAAVGVAMLALQPVDLLAPAHWFINNGALALRHRPLRSPQLTTSAHSGAVGMLATRNDNAEGLVRDDLMCAPDDLCERLYNDSADGIVQYLPESTVRQLRGTLVTVGGWVRAPRGAALKFPALEDQLGSTSAELPATGEWEFRARSMRIDPGAEHLAMVLHPGLAGNAVYDELVVAPGEFNPLVPPQFNSAAATSGSWDGVQFTNLLRNGSAEQRWPRIRFVRLQAYEPNQMLWGLLSWQRTSQVYLAELPAWIFSMYWSSFGGTQPGLTRLQLLPFAGLTLLALAGLLLALWRTRGTPERKHLLLLVGTCVVLWGVVFIRADVWPNRTQILTFAGARYGLPATMPASILLAGGLLAILGRKQRRLVLAGVIVMLFIASTYILMRVQLPFIACPLEPKTQCMYGPA